MTKSFLCDQFFLRRHSTPIYSPQKENPWQTNVIIPTKSNLVNQWDSSIMGLWVRGDLQEQGWHQRAAKTQNVDLDWEANSRSDANSRQLRSSGRTSSLQLSSSEPPFLQLFAPSITLQPPWRSLQVSIFPDRWHVVCLQSLMSPLAPLQGMFPFRGNCSTTHPYSFLTT